MTCDHLKSVTTDMSKHGVFAQVTVCAACGHPLDYRPLRHVDVTGACDLPEESMIQARAKINPDGVCEETGCKLKGQEVILEPPLPVKRHRSRANAVPVLCEKHGGDIEPCDTGERRAHNCHHAKWNALMTFAGPCACLECHEHGADDRAVSVG